MAERAVRRVKEGTSAVLLQSGLTENWWADSMECYTYLRNVTDLLSDGKTPNERRFGQPFKGPIFPVCSLVEYHPITAKDQTTIHQFGKKVFLGLFFGYALYAGGNWKGDVLLADLEELETMDASEIYSKKDSMRKRWYFPKKKENLFSNRRWTNQNPWRRSRPENIHLDTASSNSRRKSHRFSWGIRTDSSTTSWLISGCRWSDKWFLVHVRKLHIPPSRRTQSRTLLAERRIIPYSTEIHWRLQNYKYEFGCQARETHWWLLEYRWVSRLVRSLDKFHTIYSTGRKSSRRIYVVRGEINEKTADIQARSFMARTLWENGKECQAEGKAKSSISTTHENCEESILSTLRSRIFRRPLRMKHRRLPLCLAKFLRTGRIVGVVGLTELKTKLACILEASDSTRLHMGESLPNHHEDHIAGKVDNSLQHFHLVHKFIPLPQAMKIPAAKAAVDKEWIFLFYFRRGTWRKSEVRKRWLMKQRRTAKKYISPHWWTYVIWKMLSWKQSTKKYKGRVVLRCDILKDDSGSYAAFTEPRIISITNDSSKIMDVISRLPGCAAVSAYTQVKWMHPNCWKFPHRNVQTFGFVYHDTNGQNHAVWKVQSSFLSEICTVILCRTVMGNSIWGNPIATQLEVGSQMEMLVRTPWKRVILICVCGWHQIGWKETKHWSDLESTQ